MIKNWSSASDSQTELFQLLTSCRSLLPPALLQDLAPALSSIDGLRAWINPGRDFPSLGELPQTDSRLASLNYKLLLYQF